MRMLRKIGLAVAAGVLACAVAAAAPLQMISGPRYFAASGGGGSLADGATVTRTGPASTKPSVEWLGGLGGFVDANTLDEEFMNDARAGWALETPSTSQRPTFSDEAALHRTKSVAFDTRGTTEYKQTLYFDTGASGYRSSYITFWAYLDHEDLTTGYLQWKMVRWTKTQTVVDGDGSYMANRPNSVAFFNTFNSSGTDTEWFDAVGWDDLPGRRAWYRYEVWVDLNSTPGTGDGRFKVRVTDTSGTVVVDNEATDIMNNAGGDADTPYRYITLQNYFGNATIAHENAYSVAWLDDIYFSWTTSGTSAQVRAELCNNAVYASATDCRISEIVSISGTDWTVKLNGDGTGKYLALFNGSGTPTMVAL